MKNYILQQLFYYPDILPELKISPVKFFILPKDSVYTADTINTRRLPGQQPPQYKINSDTTDGIHTEKGISPYVYRFLFYEGTGRGIVKPALESMFSGCREAAFKQV